MSFYSLSDSKFTRHYREEVDMLFSALDCLLNSDRAIYCSSELTTGIRLYSALRQHGVKHVADLKKVIGEEWVKRNIWDVNVESANEFASSVRYSQSDKTLVITPAPFSAPGWSQPEYLAFWEMLIRTRVKEVRFNQNWQFSNGCTFEFAVARDADISTFDFNGNPIDSRRAIECVAAALQELSSQGFETTRLRENLERLRRHVSRQPELHRV